MPESIEPIQKVSSVSPNESITAPEMEHGQANAEHFQTLINSNQPFQTAFERIDAQGIPQEAVEKTENNPIFSDENVSSQKSGSSTDQEGKGNKRGEEDSDEIEGVSGSRSKGSADSSQSASGVDRQLTGDLRSVGVPSADQIKAQTKEIIAQFENAKNRLSSAKEIKPSYQTLLKNRLGHIDDNLKIALSKAGLEYKPEAAASPSGTNSIKKFVDSFASSQHEIDKLFLRLEEMGKPGATPLSPASMMAIQMKVGYIQQQMELFTNLLNKALESVKTVMNVQV